MKIYHWWNDKGKKTLSDPRLLDERMPTNRLSHGIASEFDLQQLSRYCTETNIS
jgi:hypothetical protein